ncbi:MAG: thioesterase family protein, partial [Curvibacter sp.]
QLHAARTNRSTQHWTAAIVQHDAQSQPVIVTTATAVTAARRETWSLSDQPMPRVPPPAEAQAMRYEKAMAWLDHYELRPVSGMIPQTWDGSQRDDSVTRLWMRDAPPRP